MKSKKLIASIVTVLGLFISLGVSARPVSAHGYIWWSHPRKVRVTKTVRIYKIDSRTPTYRQQPIKKSWLRKGKTATIAHSVSYPWVVQSKGLSHGRYFWVSFTMHGWYKLIN